MVVVVVEVVVEVAVLVVVEVVVVRVKGAWYLVVVSDQLWASKNPVAVRCR